MRECDIWADREPGSCGGAPEKSPLKPFVLFSIEKKERLGDLALRVCQDHALLQLGERRSETLDTSTFESRKHFSTIPEDCFIRATCFQWDAVPDFMANVDIHLISHS